MKIIYLFIITLLFHIPAFSAQKCQAYYDKFKHIQALQRQGHSVKASVSLHKRENKAWKQWQDCKKGKLKQKKSKTKKKHIKKKKEHRIVKLKKGSAFETTKPLTMSGEYKGRQQGVWLKYYKMPKQCKKPKSTQQFAQCLQDKKLQKEKFERIYNELL